MAFLPLLRAPVSYEPGGMRTTSFTNPASRALRAVIRVVRDVSDAQRLLFDRYQDTDRYLFRRQDRVDD